MQKASVYLGIITIVMRLDYLGRISCVACGACQTAFLMFFSTPRLKDDVVGTG
jgi:hypothetical protein